MIHLDAHDRALVFHARAHHTGRRAARDYADAALTRWAHAAAYVGDGELMAALDLTRPVHRAPRVRGVK